jgi:hypothetical protein
MQLEDALQPILHRPTPAALVALQGALLASTPRAEGNRRALEIAGQFHAYLCELESKITAQEYSELASRLDMGAVGLVALENLVGERGENFMLDLLLGGLGEILMVAASRQYVKAWRVETGAVYQKAVWVLSEALWNVSSDLQPNLPAEERWSAIQSLLAPALQAQVPAPQKALLVGRIFQLLLAIQLLPPLPAPVAHASGLRP